MPHSITPDEHPPAKATPEDALEANSKALDRWNGACLVFSLFYFMPFFYTQFTQTQIVVKLIIYVIFIFMALRITRFFGNPAGHEKQITLLILCVGLLSFFGTAVTPGTSSLFCFGGFLASILLKRLHAIAIVTGIFLAIVVSAYLFDRWNAAHLFPALMTTLILSVFGFMERMRRRYEANEKKSQAQIEQLATIAERERIARDLHDILGHTLSTISLKAQLAHKLGAGGQTEMALQEIEEVSNISSEALTEVRKAISGYKYRSINQHVSTLVQQLEENGVAVEGDYEFPALNAKYESSLVLILREAVTNILRHSNASKVRIDVKKENEGESKKLITSINDNGTINKELCEGNGLSGIRERINELAGTLAINTHSGMHLQIQLDNYEAR